MHTVLTGGVHARPARELEKKVHTTRDEICDVHSWDELGRDEMCDETTWDEMVATKSVTFTKWDELANRVCGPTTKMATKRT